MRIFLMTVLLLIAASLCGCGEGEEAGRVVVPVVADGAKLTAAFTSDLGYAIEVTSLRVVVTGLEFTTEGETHEDSASILTPLRDWVLPAAYAHPGHEGGGTIVGELPGRQVVSFGETASLGEATLLESRYDGMNFTFGLGESADGLSEDDPLLGHSVELRGEASKDGQRWSFHAVVDQDEGRRVVGVPFKANLRGGLPSSDYTIRFEGLMTNPYADGTVFDAIDLGAALSERESSDDLQIVA